MTHLKTALEICKLHNNIKIFSFTTEEILNGLLIALYIVFIAVLYFALWRNFIHNIQSELWKSKSVLGILPPALALDIPDIKAFIMKNSSVNLYSKTRR